MAVFNEYSTYYNLLYKDKNYHSEVEYIFSLIKKCGIKTTGSLLDIGCGTGKHVAEFIKKYSDIYGVDLSSEMLKTAKKNVPNGQFIQGRSENFLIDKQFDVAVSLFHVMSYQTSNKELYKSFTNVYKHLKPDGLFIFDFWYGPAVLQELPEVRIKRMENEKVSLLRIAEPDIDFNNNTVFVNYELHIENKDKKNNKIIKESHPMRYLFLPELEFMLEQAKFKIINSSKWMSDEKLSSKSWNGIIVAQK